MKKTMIEFSVSAQTLTEIGRTTILRDMSRDYIRLRFHFDETWDGLIRTVYFHTSDSAYPVLITTDEIAVPDYYAQQEEFLIMVVGIQGTTAVATNVLNISLDTAGGVWMTEPAEPPVPVYQELVNFAENAATSASKASESAEAAASFAASSVKKVNSKPPNGEGNVSITSDDILMDDGDYQWGHINVTQAIEETFGKIPSDSKINSLILALLASYVKTVNGVAPGEDGNVLLESDNIGMSDGEYGFGGYNVTQALELVNSSIPDKTVIDGYIDQKIKEIPPCVKDVKINSVSVVMREEANIALSGSLQFVSRILGITPTTEENITQRVQTRALTLNKLDSAVKAAMCDGTGAAWTESEQAAARERIGIKSTEGVLF